MLNHFTSKAFVVSLVSFGISFGESYTKHSIVGVFNTKKRAEEFMEKYPQENEFFSLHGRKLVLTEVSVNPENFCPIPIEY